MRGKERSGTIIALAAVIIAAWYVGRQGGNPFVLVMLILVAVVLVGRLLAVGMIEGMKEANQKNRNKR